MNILKQIGLGFAGFVAALSPQALAAKQVILHDGTFDGGTYDAYFGPVQVEITVQGGQVVSSKALQSPNHRRTSVMINNQALPWLEQEVIQAQSAKVNIISGATLTSRAYVKSIKDALNLSSN